MDAWEDGKIDEETTAHIVSLPLILLFLMSENLILKTTQCSFSFDVLKRFLPPFFFGLVTVRSL